MENEATSARIGAQLRPTHRDFLDENQGLLAGRVQMSNYLSSQGQRATARVRQRVHLTSARSLLHPHPKERKSESAFRFFAQGMCVAQLA